MVNAASSRIHGAGAGGAVDPVVLTARLPIVVDDARLGRSAHVAGDRGARAVSHRPAGRNAADHRLLRVHRRQRDVRAVGINRQMSVGADSTIAPLFAIGIATLASAISPHYVELIGIVAAMVRSVYLDSSLPVCCHFVRLAFRKQFYTKLYIAGIVVYALYAAYLFFSKDGMLDWMQQHHSENIATEMKATKPWIEATREVLGLVIMIVVLLVNYWYARRYRSKNI